MTMNGEAVNDLEGEATMV